MIFKGSQAARHVKEKHPHIHLILEKMNAAMEAWNIPDNLAEFPPDSISPMFEGLPIHCAYECPAGCYFLHTDKKEIGRHFRKMHANQTYNASTVSACPAQRFNKKAPLFAIIPSLPPTLPPAEQLLVSIQQQVEELGQPPVGAVTDNNRLITPWLHRTHWALILRGRSIPQLHACCQLPTANDPLLQRAVDAVEALTKDAGDNLGLLPDIILQRLNTKDYLREYVNT